MAKVVEAPASWARTRKSKYDWDQWLDGQCWELTKGEDYTVSTTVLRSAANSAAKTRGLEVDFRTFDNGASVKLKSHREVPESAEAQPEQTPIAE